MRLSRQDGRLAIRTLLKHPGFTTVAVLSLALAIALNTTMYSVIDALVNPRLDIRDPVMVYSLTFWGDYRHRLPPTAIEDALRSGLHGYEAITGSQGYRGFNPIVEHGQRFHDGTVRLVRPDFFTVLGVHPLAGRVFGPADVSVGAHPALIGERLAAELFPDGSPIGQSIRIDDNTYGVIGILGRA